MDTTIRETVEIRRSNGQCGYGDWMTADEVPARVADAVVYAVVETDADEGEVSVGGQTWIWRKAD